MTPKFQQAFEAVKGHITPPPELLQQWAVDYWGNPGESIGEGEKYIATQAARWSADQELEACIEWMKIHLHSGPNLSKQLRAARRPKPLSLKEQALEQLCALEQHGVLDCNIDKIRSALEQLNDCTLFS